MVIERVRYLEERFQVADDTAAVTGQLIKLMGDFKDLNIEVTQSEIRAAIKKFHGRAYEELAREFPGALGHDPGHDHEGLGE